MKKRTEKITWRPRQGTTWREKLYKEQEPKICTLPPGSKMGTGTIVIPRPLDVDALMRKVRKGKLVTTNEIRQKLASDYQVDIACPLCTGIFIRIAAESAEEDRRDGTKQITPYWRTLKPDGSLQEKFPGGPAEQADKLRAEGHTIVPGKGKKPPKVADFEKRLERFGVTAKTLIRE